MPIQQRPIKWTGPTVYAVLETQRPIDEPTYSFNGFANLGYIGNPERSVRTDRFLAKALNEVGWSPAMLVEWATSKLGRWFLDFEHESIESAAASLRDAEDDVLRYIRERQAALSR